MSLKKTAMNRLGTCEENIRIAKANSQQTIASIRKFILSMNDAEAIESIKELVLDRQFEHDLELQTNLDNMSKLRLQLRASDVTQETIDCLENLMALSQSRLDRSEQLLSYARSLLDSNKEPTQ